MPEYLSPGVYIEEFEIGAKPIAGVSTSTAGFLGETERGPTVPRMVTGWLDFQRVFGSYFGADKYLPYAVQGFFDNGGQRCFIGRVVKTGAGTASLKLKKGTADALTVQAVGEGSWGTRIAVKVAAGTFGGFKLSVFYWKDAPAALYDPDTNTAAKPRPTVVEVFDNLAVNESSPDYYVKKVNGISSLVTLTKGAGDSGEIPDGPAVTYLAGGDDGAGALVLADYVRTDTNEPGKRKGLNGLAEVDEISMVYSPNAQAVAGLVGALITHCETLKDRFAIIDAAQGSASISSLDPRSSNDTKYAAFYYPWIKVIDPAAGVQRLVPPGGHMAGIYARTDVERGVHKAPANESVRGAVDLEFQITKGEQDILNPRGVNCIRFFPGRGIRVWGARTLSSDALWKYINVRRLFIFLEESIEEGTQWVVFEPNDEKLWARVKRTLTEFLTRVWRDGALMGTKPEEAFFVKVDRSTMTQDDIDNGRLIVLIGVAPVKPAEFVIFRIAQYAGGSEVTE
ncbi:MAG: phage tail protein [Firmicutes bacterium HGW-Firmicutes-14]|nr:MAG: phage tail protein [Firmicutes bacterium HGW-Firmicutes-14]